MRRRAAAPLACLAALAVRPASAHDAFGDIGPFHGGLAHPLADPAQLLVLAGCAVLLARQPIAGIRLGFAAFALAVVVAVAGRNIVDAGAPGSVVSGGLAVLLGALAIAGQPLPGGALAGLAAAAACVAGFALDRPAESRAAALAAAGGMIGLVVVTLLLLTGFRLLRARLGGIVCAVAGAWVAAIGIMVAALPG